MELEERKESQRILCCFSRAANGVSYCLGVHPGIRTDLRMDNTWDMRTTHHRWGTAPPDSKGAQCEREIVAFRVSRVRIRVRARAHVASLVFEFKGDSS